jgi:hypothetical protein
MTRLIASLALAMALTGCASHNTTPTTRDLTPAEEIAILESLDSIPVR